MSLDRREARAAEERGQALLWVLAVVAVVIVAGVFFWNGDQAEAAVDPSSLYTVGRERLRITVVESGQLKAATSEDINSKIRGQTTILEIVDEGAIVKEGDLLVRLDASSLEDDLTQQKIRYETALSEFIQADESLEIQRSTNASDISQAELKLNLAMQDLEKYEKGDYPMAQEERVEDIRIKEMELARAEQEYLDTKELFELDFAAKIELDSDFLAFESKKTALKLAESRQKILEQFDHKRDLQVLKWDVQEFENELERVRRRAKADLAQKEAAKKSRQATLELEESKLRQLEEQIAAAVVYAPKGGMVVYPSNSDSRFRGNDSSRIQEGASIRERQLIISLPDTSNMLAQLKVHEASIDKVGVGQACMVTIDALDTTFVGRVSFVAPLPDSTNMWMNPDLKEYRVEVSLGGDTSKLRPGMSISAEILVEEVTDALTVPVHAVRNQAGNLFTYLRQGERVVIRPVTIGLNNHAKVVIAEGLQEGDQVYLSVPPGAPEPDFDPLDTDEEISVEEWRAQAETVALRNGRGAPGGVRPGAEGAAGAEGSRRGGFGGMDPALMERMRNATEEERAQILEEMRANMSPEDRARMDAMRNRGGGNGAGGFGGRGSRGEGGDAAPRGDGPRRDGSD